MAKRIYPVSWYKLKKIENINKKRRIDITLMYILQIYWIKKWCKKILRED